MNIARTADTPMSARLKTPRFGLAWLFGLTAVASVDLALIKIGGGMLGLAFTLWLLLCLDLQTEKLRLVLAAVFLLVHLVLIRVA